MSYAPLDESSESNGSRRPSATAALMNGTNGHGSSEEFSRSTSGAAAVSTDAPSPTSSPLRSSSSSGSRQQQRPSSLSEPLTNHNHNNSNSHNHSRDDDPFYVFREDLYRKLELVDESLAEYLRVVHQTDTAVNSHELKETKRQLKRHLKNAEATLHDVQMTVQVVENDKTKFPHITQDELYQRRSFVQTSRDRLARAKLEKQSQAVKAKLLADERAKALRRSGARSSSNNNGDVEQQQQQETTDFIVDSQARTSLLMQHQDETLEELDVAVTRVGDMAEHIHDEIGQQNKMLTEMQDDLANAEEELGLVMGKLAKFLHTKNQWQLGTIVTLFFIMIILLFLVIYV